MPITHIQFTPSGDVALQAAILDENGVSIVKNAIDRILPSGDHTLVHNIEGPLGASCGIEITVDGNKIKSVAAGDHKIVQGETFDGVEVDFTV